MAKAAKLGLAGIYLMPGTSRSKPSIIYAEDQEFYHKLFNENRENNAKIIKDLLYLDNYYETKFKKNYQSSSTHKNRIAFSNNARTLILAYCGFLSKIINNKISPEGKAIISNLDYKNELEIKKVQKLLSCSACSERIISKEAYEDMDKLENNLYRIFSFIVKIGAAEYRRLSDEEKTNETNWLKKDSSFYRIISGSLDEIIEEISEKEEYNVFKIN